MEDYILGGTITSCSATYGGAIYQAFSTTVVHIVDHSSGKLTISECTNTHETATDNTDGYHFVYLSSGSINVTPVYQVTFRDNNTDFAVLHVLQGTSLGEAFPAAPAKAGIRFLGWYNGDTQITSSTVINDNITVTAKWAFYGSGIPADPYQIPSTDAWNFLADNVNNGNTYSEKVFQMTNNISVTTMVGASTYDGHFLYFSGTFDGNRKTLDVSISGTGSWTALFGALNGATIKNLHITGSITTDGIRVASIAGFISGNSTIENCWSEVAISSSLANNWIDAGAFVARVNSGTEESKTTLTLNGCLFTGSITYSDKDAYEGGGMVGWAQDKTTVNFSNSVFAPSAISITKYIDQYTLAATYDGYTTKTIDNCYYNDVANATDMTKEGKHWHSITAGDDVTISGLGAATVTYNVSGITAYSNGIKYDGVYYAGDKETVNLTLSHGPKSGYTFSQYAVTGGGTLDSPVSNTPTLTMTDADQVINAEWTENKETLDQAVNNSSFITNHAGLVYDITLTRTLQAGGWNTFCVPFNTATPSGWTVRELTDASYNEGTKTLTLNFGNAASIVAGHAYLVKVDAEVATPTFNDVKIVDGTTPTTIQDVVSFIPVMNPTTLPLNDKSCLFVSGGTKLTWAKTGSSMPGFRAYFQLLGDAATNARSFAMSFDDETTMITTTDCPDYTDTAIWHTLDGCHIEGQPIRKGVYIHNGKKTVIK